MARLVQSSLGVIGAEPALGCRMVAMIEWREIRSKWTFLDSANFVNRINRIEPRLLADADGDDVIQPSVSFIATFEFRDRY